MIFRRAREVVSALDDQIAFIEWREKSDGRGLRCELFDDTEFKSPRKVRHADKLSFITWSDPDIDVPGDAFCMRWTGFLRPPVAGRYKLLLRGDDTAQIWLDEKLVLDVTRNRGEAIIDLTTKPTALRAELTDLGGAAAFSFQWIAPGTDRATVVPSDCFFTDAEAAARLGGKPLTFPRGRGLRAELFAGRDFQRPLLTRTDANINNDFERAAPDPRLPVAFSIRWSGFLKPPKPGRYKLTASVDDGVRLWIDNHLVLERWPSFPNDHDVTLDLTARPHMIVVEYHQIANPGFITLHWQNLDEPNAPRVPIPPEAFFTDRAVAERAGVFDLKLEQ
jgi:hypothetical protein